MTDLKDTLAALSEADLLAELGLLYNHKDDDSRQFTRWQMLVAIQHGMSLAARSGQLVPVPRVEKLIETLAWYGEQARLARLIHSEGDTGRHALRADGGKKARAFIAAMKGEVRGDG